MNGTTPTIVQVQDAYKRYYSRKNVLKGLSMKIEKGTIYALLGPSGCGKTTLLKCILGRKRLDAGEIILGVKYRHEIGYMPQEVALVEETTIKETIDCYSWIYKLRGAKLEERKRDLFKFLKIPAENSRIKQLSGGQKRRISLCIALLHDPDLIILDEPTAGVDPVLCASIWEYFIEMSTRNRTIVMTTHYIEEARHANKIGMMRHGVLVEEGEPLSMMKNYGSNSLEEVFILLSHQQEMECFKTGLKIEPRSLKLKVKPKLPLNDEKFLSLNNLIACFLKIFYHLRYSTLTFFLLLFIPITTCIIFEYTVGREVVGLKLGVVNEELINSNKDCSNFSNVTCFPASCDYQALLQKKIIIVWYKDISSARSEADKNQISGYLHISRNFTESLFQRISHRRGMTDEDQSEISVSLDMSNYVIANHLRNYIYLTYFDFLDNLSSECKWKVRHYKIPIQYNEPVFGTNIPNFKEFFTNAMVLLIEFFTPAGYALTILQDKRGGILERHLISGITYPELLIGHMAMTLLQFVVQSFCAMGIFYQIYGHIFEGNFTLAFCLAFLVGICGTWFGICVAMLFDTDTNATFFAAGALVMLTHLSGMLWPTEGMHPYLRSVSWFFPLTLATDAYRSITARAWTLSNPVIYSGFLSILFWILFFILSTYAIIEIRKKNETQ